MGEAVGLLGVVVEGRAEVDDDGLVRALVDRGVDRRTARRLVVFVPMAMGRVLLDGLGITFADTYLVSAADPITQYPLGEVDEFVTASTAAAEGRLSGAQVSALALRSAEVAAVNKALEAGSRPEDLVLGPAVTTWAEAVPESKHKPRRWGRRRP